MFEFFGRVRERKIKEAAENAVRIKRLRTRLRYTMDFLVETLIDVHDLSDEAASLVKENSQTIKMGFDLVLIEGMDAYDAKVPNHLQGGAIIAYSADAFSSLSANLDKADLERMIGSLEDKETTGHMCCQLGFSRDGSAVLENPSASGKK